MFLSLNSRYAIKITHGVGGFIHSQPLRKYLSVFSPCTLSERTLNFDRYWSFSQNHSGEIIEDQKDLQKKKELLTYFISHPVRTRKPLSNPELFYRNYVHMQDDPKAFDKKTLLLTCIYKFARHEWVGIANAWDAIPSMSQSKTITDKISRYHLCEEFCHVRFFNEMFITCRLYKVEWVPLGKWMTRIYRMFPYFPESLMSPPAFITELMGMIFYIHVDRLLDTIFEDEPEARDRIRALLQEIMVDELAHVGQRRNFIGSFGIKMAKKMVSPLFRVFFKDIPEAELLFDINQMVRDGLVFDYNQVSSEMLNRSWIPSYCQA